MIARRRFLKLMGVGSAAAPMAAKAAAEQEALKLTQFGKGNAALLSSMAEAGPGGVSWTTPQKQYDNAAAYVKLFGMPAHVEKSVRERASYVQWLDHDIASKRSWSLAYKVLVQRERNFASYMQSYAEIGWYERAQGAFEKIAGFRWPW